MKLGELATLIRSKNAGPFNLTFDVMVADAGTYQHLKHSGVLDARTIAERYGCAAADVRAFACDNALAFKFTIPRPRAQGDPGDGDLHGGQQYAPLLDIDIPEPPPDALRSGGS